MYKAKGKDNKYNASTDFNTDGETQVQVNRNNCTNNVPIMPSTASSSHEPSRSTSSDFRANEGDSTRLRIQRSDFNKLIQQDIEAQAISAAKRRRTSQEKPNLASKSSIISHDVRQSQRAAEFKDNMPTNARERTEHGALFRLLSGGHRDNELPAGRLHRILSGGTTEFGSASTSHAGRLPDWDSR